MANKNQDKDIDSMVNRLKLKQQYLPDRYPSENNSEQTGSSPTEPNQDFTWQQGLKDRNDQIAQKLQGNKAL